ncbi:MAG: AAA family ATPase [Acidimicrobiales bacterium]
MLDEIERAVIGKRQVLELVMVAILARGHVLLEDYPGLAKTLIARCFASVTGLTFSRIQFTPDLMPSDVTGSAIYDQASREPRFVPGPVFTNLLLGDEINRAPPKTQVALLEAMAEGQVTTDGVTRVLPVPFIVLATQNPIEFEGTYPLPEAQLDRFLLRSAVGYPAFDQEVEMLSRRTGRKVDAVELRSVSPRETLLAMQRAVEEVHVSRSVASYMVELASATRSHPSVEVGASPRATMALLLASRARAAMSSRDFVTPDDVKSLAVPVLAHRLSLRPETWVRGVKADAAVLDCLEKVSTPPVEEPAG